MKPCVLAAGTLLCLGMALGIERQSPIPPLSLVRRVYVEPLGGGINSDQMRDMIIAAVQNSGLFILTETREGADATLKGSSDDKVFREVHNSEESIGLHASSGLGSASSNRGGTTSSHQSGGAGVSNNEASHIEERRHEATASVRLISDVGDVIWSTTQESGGGKFRGAMADVADKVVRQLSSDMQKARAEARRRETSQ